VALYIHSPNTPPWCVAQLKHRDNFTFYLYLLENIVLSNTFGRKKDNFGVIFRMLHKCELQDMYSSPYIVTVVRYGGCTLASSGVEPSGSDTIILVLCSCFSFHGAVFSFLKLYEQLKFIII
jgi:hypothetical protein